MRSPPLIAIALLAGCAVDDGRGFARLSAELWSHFEGLDPSQGRLSADGWMATDNGFEVKLTRLQLAVEELRLLASTTAPASGACTFDPSSPPPGCGDCHGGHCHCDGDLKSYEEIEAGLCGPGATSTTLASIPLGQGESLLGSGTHRTLATCTPSCELPMGEASRVAAALHGLRLEGMLRDASGLDRLAGEQPALVVELELAQASLGEDLDPHEPLDRDHPYHLDLALELTPPRSLLDGISWHTLDRGSNGITVDGTHNPAAEATLATAVGASHLQVQVTRRED